MTIKQQGGIFGRNPTFNDVGVEGNLIVDTNVLYVNSSTNRVGINNANPSAPLDVIGSPGVLAEFRDGTAANFIIETSGNVTTIGNQAGSSVLAFKQSNQERMRITNDGLCFNGDTAAANALDDYEEGTWTPVPADAASGGNTGSAATAVGHYTKVGRVVTVAVDLVNINKTGLTAGNAFFLQGLPFTAASLTGSMQFTGISSGGSTFGGSVIGPVVYDANAAIRFFDPTGTITDSYLVSDVSANADIRFSLTYFA